MQRAPRASRLAPLALAALLAPADTTSAAPPMTEWKTTLEGEDLAGCTRDRFTDYCADAGGLCLAPSWLIADAMARSSKIRESLTPGMEAKKLFHLPAAVESAEVLFHGGGGTEEHPLLITVNGREIRHVQDRERMLTGGWDRETIPGRWLRPGPNELVFSGAGSLVIDADGPGRNSFKRLGGRGEWKGDMLGAGNDLTGEYVVRLRVRGHPREGVATSPVLDLAAGPAVAPGMEVQALRLSAAPETPPGSSVRFEVRSGTTALYASDEWTSWRTADSGEALPGARFVQWRAFLSSGDPAVTPLVKERDHRGFRPRRRRQPPADGGGRGAAERPGRLLLPLRLRRPAPPPHAPPAREVPPGGSRGAGADRDGEVRPAAPVGPPPVGGLERQHLQLLPPVGRPRDPGAGARRTWLWACAPTTPPSSASAPPPSATTPGP